MSHLFSDEVARTGLVIVPGWGGSSPEHWQSRWQDAHPRAVRTAPASWDDPDLEDWVEALDAAVAAQDDAPVIVAHSLGTYTAAVWLEHHPGRARAALLVAPPDPGREGAPREILGFRRSQFAPLQVPALVVASEDDPFGTPSHARWYADQLGAPLAMIGARGHINADSGLGAWPGGVELLERMLARG